MRNLSLSLCFLMASIFANDVAAFDYSMALEKSRIEDKSLLLFFTGSDWSGLGMKMKNEMFETKDFQKRAADSFVFFEVDFPHHKNLSKEKIQQNELLKNRFKIEEFPTLLILDKTEREICRLYYVPENGKQLADDLIRIVKQDKELQAGLLQLEKNPSSLKTLYELAQDLQQTEAREKILAAGVKIEDPFFLLEKYRLLVEAKNKNASDLKEKLLTFNSPQIDFTLALVEFQELANDPAKKKNPELIIRPLEEYLSKYKKQNLELLWKIEMMIAETFLEADDWKQALSHAELACRASPKEMKEEIESLITYIEKQQKTNQAIN